MLPVEKEEAKKRVETAVLSTTAKAKAKAKAKANTNADEKEDEKETEKKDEAPSSAMEVDSGKDISDDASKASKLPEPNFYDIQNPCRVTYAQQEHIDFLQDQRYRPVYSIRKRNLGVLVLTDSTPDVPDESLREIKAPPLGGEDEPEAPEPFEWIPPEHR